MPHEYDPDTFLGMLLHDRVLDILPEGFCDRVRQLAENDPERLGIFARNLHLDLEAAKRLLYRIIEFQMGRN
jgi:hypothetical protein